MNKVMGLTSQLNPHIVQQNFQKEGVKVAVTYGKKCIKTGTNLMWQSCQVAH